MFDFTTAGIALALIIAGLFGGMIYKPLAICAVLGFGMLAMTILA